MGRSAPLIQGWCLQGRNVLSFSCSGCPLDVCRVLNVNENRRLHIWQTFIKHICGSDVQSTTERHRENGPPGPGSSPGFGANSWCIFGEVA